MVDALQPRARTSNAVLERRARRKAKKPSVFVMKDGPTIPPTSPPDVKVNTFPF